MKRLVRFTLLLAAILMIAVGSPLVSEAATTAAKNKKAVNLYNEKVESLKSYDVRYKYVDLTGDGVKEAIIYYSTGTARMETFFQIYMIKKGKMEQVFNYADYGVQGIYSYKKTKGIVLYLFGRGTTDYMYYIYTGGTFRYLGMRGKSLTADTWVYLDSNYKNVSKAVFKKSVQNKVKKGTKKKYPVDKLTIAS